MQKNQKGKIIQALSVDSVIFGFEEAKLKVLLIKRAIKPEYGTWALPGGFIKYSEDISEAAYRVLKEHTGVQDLYMEQLGAFGDIDRFPDERVITIVYYALIKPGKYEINPGPDATDAAWFSLKELPRVPFDHKKIIDAALARLRRQFKYKPIGFNLLADKFPLLDLQELYEALYGVEFDKPNFRRKIMKMNLLVPLEEKQQGVPHRSARLFKFDKERYDNLTEKGFIFEF
ncbi:MAG: NUDIX hydrolase [Bacteroidales bacterium]|nr:NUDIX hydrolase [Bacteroidales bacterium]MBN2821275.1 NUDIX hydrolase [Bacteroidales bacterium]